MIRKHALRNQFKLTLNPEIIIVPVLSKRTWLFTETIPIEIRLTCTTSQSLKENQVRWRAPAWGAEGSFPVPERLQVGEKTVGYAVLPTLNIFLNSTERVSIGLFDGSGKIVSSMMVEITLTEDRNNTNVL